MRSVAGKIIEPTGGVVFEVGDTVVVVGAVPVVPNGIERVLQLPPDSQILIVAEPMVSLFKVRVLPLRVALIMLGLETEDRL